MEKRSFPWSFQHGVVLLFVFLIVASLLAAWRSPIAGAVRRGERVSGVLIGTDFVDYARHSDTLMVISYDPTSRFLDVLSIPRDTQIQHKGYRFKRINEIYAYMYKKYKDHHQAAKAVVSALEETLSVPQEKPVSIPLYGQVDYSGFRNLVDLAGGIPIAVDEPMHYDDNWGKLHIHFEPGHYWMNGKMALEYVRYRGASGDRGRIYRQQKFFKTLLTRLTHPSAFFRWPHILAAVLKCVHTNLVWYDTFFMALEAKDLQRRNLRFIPLPGKPSGNLWQIDKERTRSLLQLMATTHSAENASAEPLDPAGIIVEVWNASPHQGLAHSVTKEIRKAGFDVVKYGTYPNRQSRTLVVDRTGNIRMAQAVAQALKTAEVISNIDRTHLVDVSVIIGKDYLQTE